MTLRRSVNPEIGLQRLSGSDAWVVERLEHLPLGSAIDLADCFGKGYTTCYRALRGLEKAGIVRGADVSVGWRRQRRYWLIGRGWDGALPEAMLRHPPRVMKRLVENMGSVEAAYRMVAAVVKGATHDRQLQEFRWIRDSDVPWDAVARFSDGWMVLMWCGIWQDRNSLRKRLERMSLSAGSAAAGGTGRPGRYCFLVADEWQAEVVRRGIREFGMERISVVFNILERTYEGSVDLSRSRGFLTATRNPEEVAASDQSGLLDANLLCEDGGRILYRVMTTLEQWPGLKPKAIVGMLRMSWTKVLDALERLEERGLIWRLSGGGYGVDDSWLAMAARRDRVWNGRPSRMFGRRRVEELYGGRIGRHETGLADLMAGFVQAGCPIAPGWRGVEPMGDTGQLAPDGMVYIAEGPFGEGWHYVEYELRARHPKTVGRKIASYHAGLRADRCPVLVVCRPSAVDYFYQAGQGLDMLVATVPDARAGVVAGVDGTVWRRFGEPVPVLC